MWTEKEVMEFADTLFQANSEIIQEGRGIIPHLVIVVRPDREGRERPPQVVDVSPLHGSAGGKDRLAELIFTLAQDAGVEVVAHVCEAWVAKLDKDDPRREELMARAQRDGVSSLTEAEGRRETLNLLLYTADCQWFQSNEIERPANRVVRADLVSVSNASNGGGAVYQGRFIRERPGMVH